jgi:hypothetical protein
MLALLCLGPLTNACGGDPAVCPCAPPSIEITYLGLQPDDIELLRVTVVGADGEAHTQAELSLLYSLVPGDYELTFYFDGTSIGGGRVCRPAGGCGCDEAKAPRISFKKPGSDITVDVDGGACL